MAVLHFRMCGTNYYWANADGTGKEQLGQPGYEVRQLSRGWRAVSPDGKILASNLPSRRKAIAVCEKDVPMYERAMAGEGATYTRDPKEDL